MVETSAEASGESTFDAAPSPAIQLVQSVRTMRCYTVTDSELKQLGLANIGIAATFGVGSASFAFGLDVYKDAAMAAAIPESARTMIEVVQPICFYTGIAFWVFSAVLWFWRRDMLSLIKRESKST